MLWDDNHPDEETTLGQRVYLGHRLAPLLYDHIYADTVEMTREMRTERDNGALEGWIRVMPADSRNDNDELVMHAGLDVVCDLVNPAHAAPREEHAVDSHSGTQRRHRPDESKDPAKNTCMRIEDI
jgi:hypothetical protein